MIDVNIKYSVFQMSSMSLWISFNGFENLLEFGFGAPCGWRNDSSLGVVMEGRVGGKLPREREMGGEQYKYIITHTIF